MPTAYKPSWQMSNRNDGRRYGATAPDARARRVTGDYLPDSRLLASAISAVPSPYSLLPRSSAFVS